MHNRSLDEACDLFTTTFMDLVKECIPCKKVCIRPDDQPWYDNAIRRLSRKRDRMKRTAKASKKSTDWSKYKNLRNYVNNMKKNMRKKISIKAWKQT